MLAADQQWEQRARWIQSEFGITAATPVWTTGTSLNTTVGVPAVSGSMSGSASGDWWTGRPAT